MTFYKVTHKYKSADHFERKAIGIYSSEQNAAQAIECLKQKVGFRDTPNGFRTKKVFRLFRPKWVDKTFWIDGFVTYTY